MSPGQGPLVPLRELRGGARGHVHPGRRVPAGAFLDALGRRGQCLQGKGRTRWAPKPHFLLLFRAAYLSYESPKELGSIGGGVCLNGKKYFCGMEVGVGLSTCY